MRTRSSNHLVETPPNPSTSNPKRHNCRRSKQPFILKESLVDTMVDQRTMAELLRAPTEGYAEEIVVPPILTEQFELNHILINIMTSDLFFGLEKDNPPDHIRWDRYKDLLRACPHHGFTELHQLDTFYNALNLADQYSLNSAAGGNLLERRTQDVLTIIENKSKCLATGGDTFPELRDNIQGYVAAAAVNYNQGSGSLPSNTVANPKDELKSITTRSGIVLEGPFVPIPLPFINPKEDERVEETLTDQDLTKDPLHPNIPYPSRMLKQKLQEKEEVQIHKFWKMFKQLHVNITLADALILIPKYKKMHKSLLSNKEKLKEVENTPLNENCSAVILKKLPEKLGDPGKFLILCGFSELKYKSLANLGASINLMPLIVWKKLDVFVPVGKFTFPADFVIVDYESDPRIEPGQGKLTSVVMKDNLAETRVHVPNVLTTHPTLMLDSDFVPFDNSLPEFKTFYFDIKEKNSGSTIIYADISLSDLESFNFDFKPDLSELTSIVDSKICENILSTTNVNLPPEEDHSPLFAYVVWIFISFLTNLMVPPHLFSFGNEDTIFDPGIANHLFPSLLRDVSHWCETFMKFNDYLKLLNENTMEILSSSCSPVEK
nr:reverse transcriptase domain-containing protein [Tanacetum cinerariifolium]